eukprot:6205485-Pleurochrysis_carterae.AAC.2
MGEKRHLMPFVAHAHCVDLQLRVLELSTSQFATGPRTRGRSKRGVLRAVRAGVAVRDGGCQRCADFSGTAINGTVQCFEAAASRVNWAKCFACARKGEVTP